MPGRVIERLSVQLSAEDQRLVRGLERSERAVRRARQRINRDVGLIARRAAQATGALALAAGGAVAAIGRQADEIGRLAQSIGTTAEEYQVLEAAFNRAGLDGDAVAAVINRLNEVIAEARDGSEPLRLSLSRLGLTYQELESLTPTDALQLFIERLNQLDDQAEVSRIGLEIFQGDFERGGPIFRSGGRILDEVRRTLNANGGLISQNTIDRVRDFTATVGTAGRIARTNFFEGFIDRISEFGNLSDHFDTVANSARTLGETIGNITQFLIEYRNIIIGIGSAFGALTIARPFVQAFSGIFGGSRDLIIALRENTAAQLQRSGDDRQERRRRLLDSTTLTNSLTTALAVAVGTALAPFLRTFRIIGTFIESFASFYRNIIRYFAVQDFAQISNDFNRRTGRAFEITPEFSRASRREHTFTRRSLSALERASNVDSLFGRLSTVFGSLLIAARAPTETFDLLPEPTRRTSIGRNAQALGLAVGSTGNSLRNALQIPAGLPSVLGVIGGFYTALRVYSFNIDRLAEGIIRYDLALRDATNSLTRIVTDLPNQFNLALDAALQGISAFFTNNTFGLSRNFVDADASDAPDISPGNPLGRQQREQVLDFIILNRQAERLLEIQNNARLPLPDDNGAVRARAAEIRRQLNEDILESFADSFSRSVRNGLFDDRVVTETDRFNISSLVRQAFLDNNNIFQFDAQGFNPDGDPLGRFDRNILNPNINPLNRFGGIQQQVDAAILTTNLPDINRITLPPLEDPFGIRRVASLWERVFDTAEETFRAEGERLVRERDENAIFEAANITQELIDASYIAAEDARRRRLEERRRVNEEIAEIERNNALAREEFRFENLGPIDRAVETTGLTTNFYENFAQRFGDGMRTAFLNLDLSGSLSDFADSVGRSIVNGFRQSLADQIGSFFGNLIQDIFSRRGRGGSNAGGGLFSTLLALPFSGGRAGSPRQSAGGTINLGPLFERRGFASGGFVPGTAGQAIPITAHGGELILNQTQQAALFRAANGESIFDQSPQTFNFNAQFVGDTTQQTLEDVRQEAENISRINQAELAERGFTNGVI